MNISEPTLSIDKISFLVHSPSLSHESSNKRISLEDRCKILVDILESEDCPILDIHTSGDKGSTENYYHHFKLSGGFDLEFGTKRKIRNKIGEEEVYGPNIPNGLTVHQFFLLANDALNSGSAFEPYVRTVNLYDAKDSDYGIRFEFNPNKVTDYSSLDYFFKEIFPFINPFYKDEYKLNKLIKITKIDMAIDYPYSINPLMFTSRANHMNIHITKDNGVETVYFGAPRSKRQVRLYNKKVEIEKKNGRCDNEHLWRFEMSFTDSFFFDDQPTVNSKGKFLSSIFDNPFKNFKYYNFDEIVQQDIDDFQIYCLLHSAKDSLGIHALIYDFASKKYDCIKQKHNWISKTKSKLKSYEKSFGPITPPLKVYDDQFLFVWGLFKGDIRNCLKLDGLS